MFSTMRLNNGSEVPKITYVTAKMNLDLLINKDQIAFNELVQKCKTPEYKISEGSQKEVDGFGLMKGGFLHNDVRNIVLSLASDMNSNFSTESRITLK